MSNLSGARRLAVDVCREARERDAFAAEVLDARLGESSLSAADRAFARVLVLGVASTYGTLDEVLDRCMNSPHDVNARLRDALRISTYEIIFLQKDGYAAVDQGVSLAHYVSPRAKGLANAVLRRVLRARLDFPFADPRTDDAALARYYGFPEWLGAELIKQMGRSAAASFMDASNQPPTVYFAVNAARASDDDVVRLFSKAGVELEPARVPQLAADGTRGLVDVPGCYLAPDATAVATSTAHRMFGQGAVLVSDLAAQSVSMLALPQRFPGAFLEVGAGRGTKTVLLQSDALRKWGRQMRLTSVDDHDFKVNVLRKRADLCGVEVAHAVCADARDLQGRLSDEPFDAVLVDAPCSGLGTLRRHPEIRWRIAPKDIADMSDLQFELLSEAARYVAPHGQLTYATCSVMAQENEYVVKRFIESERGRAFRIQPTPVGGASKLFCKTVLEGDGPDAHFAARLVRTR